MCLNTPRDGIELGAFSERKKEHLLQNLFFTQSMMLHCKSCMTLMLLAVTTLSTATEDHIVLIGAAFGRTGTSSTKAALEILGVGPTHHMDEVNS